MKRRDEKTRGDRNEAFAVAVFGLAAFVVGAYLVLAGCATDPLWVYCETDCVDDTTCASGEPTTTTGDGETTQSVETDDLRSETTEVAACR